jgi:hypothetical protein
MHVLATHFLSASMHLASRLPAKPPINLEGPTKLAIHWGWLKITEANLVMFLLVVVVFLVGIFVPYRGNKKALAAAMAQQGTPSAKQSEAGAA